MGLGRPYSHPALTAPRFANEKGPLALAAAPTPPAFYQPLPFLAGQVSTIPPSSFLVQDLGGGAWRGEGSLGLSTSSEGGSVGGGVPDPKCFPSSLGQHHPPVQASYFGFYCRLICLMPHLITPLQDLCFFRFASWAVLTAQIKLTTQRS